MTNSEYDIRTIWGSRDTGQNTSVLYEYLDFANRLKGIKAAKKQSFDLLQMKAGDQILDIGCGTGEDTIALQVRTENGRVIGVDKNNSMLAEAKRRLANENRSRSINYIQADAEYLPFRESSFDGCRAERLLLHVREPQQAVRQMAQVVKPGSWIVLTEPDLDTLVVNSFDKNLTRRILAVWSDGVPNSCVGRKLQEYLRLVGVRETVLEAETVILKDFNDLKRLTELPKTLYEAERKGMLPFGAVKSWLNELEKLNNEGLFFSAYTMFIAAGCRPFQ